MTVNETFDQFVTALESNDMDLLNKILDPGIQLASSAHGSASGITEVKQALAWKGEPLDFKRIRVFNNVIRSNGEKGAQSCYLVVMLGKMERGFMNIFQCAFLNAIDYKMAGDGWVITQIKSNMTFECGNTLLVSNQWSLIDYGVLNGNRLDIIDAHEDSPWAKVPVDDRKKADERKIMEAFWHYNWMIDAGAYDELSTLTTDGVNSGGREGFRDWLASKRYATVRYGDVECPKEACWNHISTFEGVAVDGDHASTTIYRFEPNRIGSRFMHKYNMETMYFSAIWSNDFVKGEDGEWLMDTFNYQGKIIERGDFAGRRYF